MFRVLIEDVKGETFVFCSLVSKVRGFFIRGVARVVFSAKGGFRLYGDGVF